MSRAGRIVLAASLLLVPLVPLPALVVHVEAPGDPPPPRRRGVHDFDLPKWALAGMLIAGVAAAGAAGSLRERLGPGALPPGALALLLLTALAFASAAWAEVPHLALRAAGRLALLAGFYLGFGAAPPRPHGPPRAPPPPRASPSWDFISLPLSAAATVVALYGVAQTLGWDLPGIPWRGLRKPVSTLGNTNIASEFLVAAIPFLLGRLLLARRATSGALFGAGALVCLVHIALTRTRAGWISLAAGIAVGALVLARERGAGGGWGGWRRAGARLAPLPAGLVLVLALPGLGGGGVWREAASIPSPRHPSTRVRVQVWSATASMFLDHPIGGVGAGNFRVQYPRYRRPAEADLSGYLSRVDTAHDDYLEMAAELGAGGLALWLLFLGLVGAAGLAAGRPGRGGEGAGTPGPVARAASGAAVAGVAVNLLFRSPLHNPAAMVAFAAAAALWTRGSGRGLRLGGGGRTRLAALALPLVALPLVLGPTARLAADRRIRQALGWQAEAILAAGRGGGRGDAASLGRALEAVRLGLRADPRSVELWSRLARYEGKLGHPEGGVAAARRALALAPHDPGVMASLGTALAGSGQVGEGLRLLESARDLAPANPVIWFDLGLVLAGLGRDGEAIFALEQAATFRPRHARTYEELRSLYERLDPRTYLAMIARADSMRLVCEALDRVDGAGLDEARLEEARLDEALGLARRARDLSPEGREPRLLLGLLLAARGRVEEGAALLSKAGRGGLGPAGWLLRDPTVRGLLGHPGARQAARSAGLPGIRR